MDDTRSPDPSPLATLEATAPAGPPRVSVDDRPRPGTAIGRYVVLEILGEGGMGVVFAAYDPELDRKVAVKLLRRSHGRRGTDGRQRLLREAQAMAKLADPNVIAVHDVGEWRGSVFVAMEFVDGQTLTDALESLTAWTPIVELFVQAAAGLDAAHQAGIVHRDFKPDNCIVGRDGRLRVLDFGLARGGLAESRPDGRSTTETTSASDSAGDSTGDSAGDSLGHGPGDALGRSPGQSPSRSTNGGASVSLTKTGAIMGTPAYMAPEQHLGQPTGPRTDQFSFCVALFEAVYGVRPYPGETAAAVMMNVVEGNLREVDDRRGVPRWLHRALVRGLAVDPEQRWPSMADLLEQLRRPARARQRRRRFGTAAAAVALVLAGFGLVAALRAQRDRRAAEQRQRDAAARLEALRPELHQRIAVGDHEGAWSTFEAFAELDAIRGTVSVSKGWLDLANELTVAGEVAPSLQAAANAYTTARDGDARERVLFTLVESFHADARWDGLDAALRELGPSEGGLAEPAAVTEARSAAALARRDFRAAATVDGATEAATFAPLAQTLAGATVLPADGSMTLADLDLDGRDELLVHAGERLEVRDPSAGFETIASVDFPGESTRLFPLPGTEAVLAREYLSGAAGRHRNHFLTPLSDANSRGSFDDNLVDVASADLDGDGIPEHYGAISYYSRKLVRLVDDGTRWAPAQVHPETDGLRADVIALAPGDFDGDDQIELAVALGSWTGYQVRVLEWSPESQRMVEIAERELGIVPQLATIPGRGRDHLVALKVDGDGRGYGNFFGPEQPLGPIPAGLHELALDEGSIGVRDSIATPPALTTATARLDAADLDGDGAPELLLSVRGEAGSWVIARDDAGRWLGRSVRGMQVLAVGQLDGDPADELLVRTDDGRFALGFGEAALPSRPTAASLERPVPPSFRETAELRATWRRAEELVGMGLAREAVATFARIAALSSTHEGRVQATLRAGALAEAIDDDARALALYDAGLGKRGDPRLLAAAADAAERLHEFSIALAHRRALDDETGVARLLAIDVPPEPLVTDDLLPAATRFHRPGEIRHVPGRGLFVTAMPGGGPVLSIPVDVDGPRVSLDVEGTILRSEWGSGLAITVRDADGRGVLSGRLRTVGSSDSLSRWLEGAGAKVAWTPSGPGQPQPFSIHLDVVGERVSARFVGGEATTRRAKTTAIAPGRYELVIAGTDPVDGPPLITEIVVNTIAVRGMTPSAAPPEHGRDRLARLAVSGSGEWPSQLDAALLELAEAPAERVWLALEFDRRGQRDQARALLAPLIDTPPDSSVARELQVAARLGELELLEASWGPVAYEVWVSAWTTAAMQHADAVAIQPALLHGVAAIEAGDAAPIARVIAIQWRSTIHALRGDRVRARADAERVVAIGEAMPDLADRAAGAQAVADACFRLGGYALHDGDEPAAQAWFDRAVAHSRTPVLTRRKVAARMAQAVTGMDGMTETAPTPDPR